MLCTHGQLAADEQLHHHPSEGVPILVEESVHGVPHLSRVVLHAELHGGHAGSRVQLAQGVVVVALLQERQVGGLTDRRRHTELTCMFGERRWGKRENNI